MLACALTTTYNAEKNAFKHDFPANSEVLEPFGLDRLCFMKEFKYDLEKHNGYDCESNENAEEQVTREEDVRDFDLADETNSFYAFYSQMLEAFCNCHLGIGTSI